MQKIKVLNGIDQIQQYSQLFENKKLGLITNPTGINKNFESTIDILNKNYNLKALYSPEHGVRGDVQAGKHIRTYKDEITNTIVYSLYGKNKQPSEEILKDIDVLVYDIQDVGVRFYTYIYTMANAMISCAKYNKKFVVLDRINPLGGLKVEGNILNEAFKSFVGMYPITIRYGLTVGELAVFFNNAFNIGCDLSVVPLKGWNRNLFFDETDLHWISPSPNMPTFDTALLYPGTCFFEGTNISEGRGTTKPFEIIGAPWLDANMLAKRMTDLNLKGVKFRPAYFTPIFSKHKGDLCKGVQIHVTDGKEIDAVDIGINLLYAIKELSRNNFRWLNSFDLGNHYTIDYITGTDEVRRCKYNSSQFCAKWKKDSYKFNDLKSNFHIYN